MRVKLKKHIDLYDLEKINWCGCQRETFDFLKEHYGECEKEYFLVNQSSIENCYNLLLKENGLDVFDDYIILPKMIFEEIPKILDDEEKQYLKAVIKPFRNRIQYISKESNGYKYDYLLIVLNDDGMTFPIFEKDTMYKGMEVEKRYTLKELDL